MLSGAPGFAYELRKSGQAWDDNPPHQLIDFNSEGTVTIDGPGGLRRGLQPISSR